MAWHEQNEEVQKEYNLLKGKKKSFKTYYILWIAPKYWKGSFAVIAVLLFEAHVAHWKKALPFFLHVATFPE